MNNSGNVRGENVELFFIDITLLECNYEISSDRFDLITNEFCFFVMFCFSRLNLKYTCLIYWKEEI